MERKGKQKKTARNVIIILCVILVAVSIPVIMALRKSHSQPTPAETTPTPTAPPAEETVSATPSIELPPYGGYSFDNDELVQLSALKFRRFAPETILTVSIRPEKGLTRYAREAGVTDSMVASAPAAAEVAASIEAFLGERAPLVLFQSEELAFLPAAGIGCAGEGRTVYDVQSLLGKPDGKAPALAEACRDLFSFTPELGGTEQEALACGLVFCALCDRTLHLTKKSAAR